jgi:cold shock CspA family protein
MIGVVLRQSGPDAFEIHGEDGGIYFGFRRHVVGRVELAPGPRVNFARGVANNMAVNIRLLDGKVYRSGHTKGTQMQAKVRNWNPRQKWGFADPLEGGSSIFIHASQFVAPWAVKDLQTGTLLELEIGPSKTKPGKTMGVNIRVLE